MTPLHLSLNSNTPWYTGLLPTVQTDFLNTPDGFPANPPAKPYNARIWRKNA